MKRNKTDHTKFGGYIYLSDFNTNCKAKGSAKGSSVIRRIVSDRRFDNQCKANGENIIRSRQAEKPEKGKTEKERGVLIC